MRYVTRKPVIRALKSQYMIGILYLIQMKECSQLLDSCIMTHDEGCAGILYG